MCLRITFVGPTANLRTQKKRVAQTDREPRQTGQTDKCQTDRSPDRQESSQTVDLFVCLFGCLWTLPVWTLFVFNRYMGRHVEKFAAWWPFRIGIFGYSLNLALDQRCSPCKYQTLVLHVRDQDPQTHICFTCKTKKQQLIETISFTAAEKLGLPTF